jgi:hypothetical protein
MLFFYWSLLLFASSWSLSPVWWKRKRIVAATKVSCFVVPAIQTGLLRLDAVRNNEIAHMFVMNALSASPGPLRIAALIDPQQS